MSSTHSFHLDPHFAPTPDNLVTLSQYRSHLSIEAAKISVATGEFIPASAIRAGLMEEFDLDEVLLGQYLFAGEMILWERELAAMSPSERARALTEYIQAGECDRDGDEPGPFDDAADRASQQRREVAQLEEWLRDSPNE